MEAVSALLALCAANSPVTGEFPSQGQWCGALMFSLICAWTNGRVHNRYARRWFDTPSCSSWRHCYDIQQHTWEYHNRLNDLLDKFLTKAAYGNDVGQVLNLLIPFDANVREWTVSLSIWVTAWFRISTKRLFVPTSAYHQFGIVRKIWIKIKKLFFLENALYSFRIIKWEGGGDVFASSVCYFQICGKRRLVCCEIAYRTHQTRHSRLIVSTAVWASFQIRKTTGCACAGNAGNVFPATACKRSRHASRHVCNARAVMHAWIAN